MNKLLSLLLLIIFTVIPFNGYSEEYLEPVITKWAGGWQAVSRKLSKEYDEALYEIFSELYTDDFIIRAIVTPAFDKAYGLGIKRKNNKYSLLLLELTNKNDTELYNKDIKTIRFEKGIDRELAENIILLWKKMLLNTRYQIKGYIVMDGTSYRYSLTKEQIAMAGWTHSPKDGTQAKQFTQLTAFLSNYCKDNSISRNTMSKKVTNLLVSIDE